MMRRLKRTIGGLLLVALVVSSYVAWSGLTGREPVPIPEFIGGGGSRVTGTDSGFDDLAVTRSADGSFTGTINVDNSTDTFEDVIVTVDLFEGDQNVGELVGSVTVKPGTTSSVPLMSADQHVSWSEAHVDLLRYN